ncbi:MAG: TPM domain-containing protein [Rhodoferax sp.]|nr:TPM domain-containing protein [Rhodoferax sp.]
MSNRIKRVLRHRWLDESAAQRAIPADMLQRLRQRVAASEQRHGGEIRIFVEGSLPLSYLWRRLSTKQIIRQRALSIFGKLRVWDTAQNNGVLIYLLLAERAIEIVADRGLNGCVSPQMWQSMVARMQAAFQAQQFEDGLTQAIDEVSTLLTTHFPAKSGQIKPNELPDEPVLK